MNDQDDLTNFERLCGRALPLDQWLKQLFSKTKKNEVFIDYQFPTDQHKEEYLGSLKPRSEKEVIALLRKFLFPACCFPQVDAYSMNHLKWLSKQPKQPDDSPVAVRLMPYEELIERESTRRLILSTRSGGIIPSWDGIRWVLDLLPHWPRAAIDALNAYILAHAQLLPDGRYDGLDDAISVIRAKYIQEIPGNAHSTLISLTSREFEHLMERLFVEMGYHTTLTKPTRDGGRDLIAEKFESALREKVLVECKLYDRSQVGYKECMQLLGVVSKEPACRGVIVTTGHVTSGARKADPRIEVVDEPKLIQLLNEYLGLKWLNHIDRLIIDSQREALQT
jgi:restriction system protein